MGGNPPSVPLHNLAGRRVQVAGARIVPESAPSGHHLGAAGLGEGFERRKGPLEPAEIPDPRLHPGLLQDELGQEHVIGLVTPAPGKVAAVGPEPTLQPLGGDAGPIHNVEGVGGGKRVPPQVLSTRSASLRP